MRNQVLMIMKKIGLTCLVLLFVLTGCNWVQEVSLGNMEVSKVRMEMSTKSVLIELSAQVNNGSSRYLALTDVDGEIYTEEGVVARIALVDTCRIAAYTEEVVLVPVNVQLSDPLLLLKIGLNLSPEVLEGFYVKGTAEIQVARRPGRQGQKHQLALEERPLMDVVRQINLL